MKSAGKVVRWDDIALQQLKEAHTFIKKDSPKNADKVRNDINNLIKKLQLYLEVYSLDKYKANNDGSFRVFEKHRYRIAYRVTETKIRILRVRHTSREPLEY